MSKTSEPKGLFYFESKLDNDFCHKIYLWLISNKFKTKMFRVTKSNPKSRLVRHFGFKYDYSSGLTIKKTEKMPDILLELREKINEIWKDCKKDTEHFNQCIINRYEPGQGIGDHIDKTSYGPYVIGFTFVSGRYMIFSKRGEKTHRVYTKPKSMYVMSGDSRYKWFHSMDKVKNDKVGSRNIARQLCFSITFRHVPSAPKIMYGGIKNTRKRKISETYKKNIETDENFGNKKLKN